jgi:hypothetical protein
VEREHEAEAIGDDEQHGDACAECLREGFAMGQIKVGNRGGGKECDGRHQEQCRIKAAAGAVIFLDMIAQAAEQEGGAQHEQCVGDDCARDRRLHQHVLARVQRGHGDDQLGEVAERCVEQAADRIAGLGGDRLGGVAEKCRQRHNGKDREYE